MSDLREGPCLKAAIRYLSSVEPGDYPLWQWQDAVRYLTGGSLSFETPEADVYQRQGLGLAPDGWDNLIRAMGETGYDKSDLLDVGLVVKSKEGRVYDRFRNRVMFPIIDLRGAVIGFGGRALDEGTPKYLNSPDTVVFNKGRNLFALNIAKRKMCIRDRLRPGRGGGEGAASGRGRLLV